LHLSITKKNKHTKN